MLSTKMNHFTKWYLKRLMRFWFAAPMAMHLAVVRTYRDAKPLMFLFWLIGSSIAALMAIVWQGLFVAGHLYVTYILIGPGLVTLYLMAVILHSAYIDYNNELEATARALRD